MSNFRWNIRRPSAPLGTPENPEIIEPGESRTRREPPPAAAQGRFGRAFRTLLWMAYISAPALFFDSLWFWLFEIGREGGGVFAWLLLVLCTPPAVVLTLIAMVANSFLLLVFFSTLLGKPISEHPAGFVRFIRLGR